MGIDLKLRRRSLRNLPEEFAVAKAVLIVLICLSMKPLDFGYRGDEVVWSMYWDARNFWTASEENRGPLSEKNLFGGPYCEIKFCNFLTIDLAVLEDIW